MSKIIGVTVGTPINPAKLSGKSAYDIAVEHGFEGDEAAWLKSLEGKDGYTPVKGVDYFTDADKSELVSHVITALGGTPIFGRVDENNNIILTGALVEGEYILKYENDEGVVTEICRLTIGANEPTYINYANPTSADWLDNKRINSSLQIVEAQGGIGNCVTNFIPCKAGDTIRVKGLNTAYYYADANKTLARGRICFYSNTSSSPIFNKISADDAVNYINNGDEWTFAVGAGLDGDTSAINYIRLHGYLYDGYTKNDVIITVNQEIN